MKNQNPKVGLGQGLPETEEVEALGLLSIEAEEIAPTPQATLTATIVEASLLPQVSTIITRDQPTKAVPKAAPPLPPNSKCPASKAPSKTSDLSSTCSLLQLTLAKPRSSMIAMWRSIKPTKLRNSMTVTRTITGSWRNTIQKHLTSSNKSNTARQKCRPADSLISLLSRKRAVR